MSDETHVRKMRVYRIFVRLGSHRYYAHSIPGDNTGRVNWYMADQAYPDIFSKRELNKVVAFYNDQRVEHYSYGLMSVSEMEKEDA